MGQIPHERSLVEKLKDKPFAVLGVNSDEDRAELKRKLAEEKMTWRHWFDGGSTEGPIATAWNVSGWPTSYVIDQDGIIRARDLYDAMLEKQILSLLDKARAKDVESGK